MSYRDDMQVSRDRVEEYMHYPKATYYRLKDSATKDDMGWMYNPIEGYYDEMGGVFCSKSGSLYFVDTVQRGGDNRMFRLIVGTEGLLGEVRLNLEEESEDEQ